MAGEIEEQAQTTTLAARLRARPRPTETPTIGGEVFTVKGLSRGERGKLQAKCRDKNTGKLDSHRLEGELLCACVFDEYEQTIFANAESWDSIDADITGPLIEVVMKLTGFSSDDLGKGSDGKDS